MHCINRQYAYTLHIGTARINWKNIRDCCCCLHHQLIKLLTNWQTYPLYLLDFNLVSKLELLSPAFVWLDEGSKSTTEDIEWEVVILIPLYLYQTILVGRFSTVVLRL